MTVRRALAFSYIERYGSYGLSLISTMIISRLLGPTEIGVFAVGMAVVGIIAVLREFGITTYLVQETELNDQRIRVAFTLTVGLAAGLALALLLLSIPAGRFYHNSAVTAVIVILAFNFVLTPLGSVSQALLTRELRFGTLTWIRLSQSLILGIASVGLAIAGLGPQSLAWAAVLATVANAALSLWARPHPLRFTFDRHDLKRVFAVGGPATAISIIEDLVATMPELVLGRSQGLAAAGLFSRARGLSQMAHQLIARAAGPVFFATFAERHRDGQPLAPLYAKAVACVTGLGWVALAMIGVLAEPVVRVLYGVDWLAVVPLLRLLCIAAAIALLTSGAHHLMLAGGGVRDVLHAKLSALPAHALSLVVGAAFGAEWMAASMILSTGYATWLMARAVQQRLGIGLRDQLLPAVGSLPMTLVAGAGAAIAELALGPGKSIVHAMAILSVGGAVGGVAAAVTLAVGGHPLRDEVSVVRSWVRRISH